MDFERILERFWEGFGRVWETKLDQKSIKNRYGKMMKFLEASWRHLGGILEASWKLLEASGGSSETNKWRTAGTWKAGSGGGVGSGEYEGNPQYL